MDPAQDLSDSLSTNLKRKRSNSRDSPSYAAPPAKAPRTSQSNNNTHLQINYLARQVPEDLPLITADDTLPSILGLLDEYHGVIERHESLACNLGARPLGPILIKRFERLFDGPPRVIKAHNGKDGSAPNVTWLDVVEFARNKPEQFNLDQMSEGVRVCQFYTKQCRVQISEEDFLLIGSGMPQKLIPPQPIAEDEEKELGTLEILERNTGQISHLADQVAARARQFNHRIRGRKQAIIDRRASDTAVSGAVALRASSPSNVALMNGNSGIIAPPLSPGFIAVNSRHMAEQPAESNISNGHTDPATVSQATHDELLKNFFTIADRRDNGLPQLSTSQTAISSPTRGPASKPSRHSTVPRTPQTYDEQHIAASLLSYNPESPHPVPIPTVAHLHQPPQPKPSPINRSDGGPFRAEMAARLETVPKGERILPPCDRCRRLHMDCIKNLTACLGCTKKHARCNWRDVKEDEFRATGDPSHLLQHRGSSAGDFAADSGGGGDVSMMDGADEGQDQHQPGLETIYAPLSGDGGRGDGQHQQHQQHQSQQYVRQYASREEEIADHEAQQQAAHSLAIAAMEGAQMQRDAAAAAAAGADTGAGGDLAIGNGNGNVDPGLSQHSDMGAVGGTTPRGGGRGGVGMMA